MVHKVLLLIKLYVDVKSSLTSIMGLRNYGGRGTLTGQEMNVALFGHVSITSESGTKIKSSPDPTNEMAEERPYVLMITGDPEMKLKCS